MKTKSLKNVINHFGSSIFSVQETHFRKKGNFKNENFQIFEAIRSKEGGGTMLGIHVGLQPVLICEYNTTFELLVVEVKTNDRRARVLTGYGPQETRNIEEKMLFFNAVEEEVSKALSEGISVILMGDLNNKLGKDHIKDDPKEQSENGTILSGIIARHALCVVNGLGQRVTGTITRQRSTTNGDEKSVIDFVIVSQDLEDMIESMHTGEVPL